jgi:hypothetical protein
VIPETGYEHVARRLRVELQDKAPLHASSPEAGRGGRQLLGSEAEELRRAVGMRRSWERMKNLEGRLRAGMTSNGLDAATQETIIQNISSFALYGFSESHAASFALIAFASAYIKVKYLAAFTCAILNNQPMGWSARFFVPLEELVYRSYDRTSISVPSLELVSGWFRLQPVRG